MAAIDSAYQYYLSTYGNSTVSRYDTHKKSQLRDTYNKIFIFFYIIIGNVEKSKKKTKKFVDDQYSVCYISLAMEVGLFFMPFFRSDLFSTKRCRKTQRI